MIDLNNIPMAQADITEAEVQAAAEVVRSGRLALGDKIPEFESYFKKLKLHIEAISQQIHCRKSIDFLFKSV